MWPHGLQHARPSSMVSLSVLKLMSIESVMPSNYFILWHFLFFLLSIFPSIKVFSIELALIIRRPKYWSFGFSISPSNEYSVLISFKINWFDLFAVQGTLKSLLRHHSLKASVLWCSVFSMVQLSHPQLTTGKTMALTVWTFVGKVMPLLLTLLSRLVVAFLPRSKWLLLSWLQLPSAVILEPKKIKSVTISIVFPSICHDVIGPNATILVFWSLKLSFKPNFSFFSFTLIKRPFSSSSLSVNNITLFLK